MDYAAGQVFTLNKIAQLALAQEQPERAIEFADKSLRLSEGSGEQIQRALSMIVKGSAYSQTGQLVRAVPYYQEGVSLAEEADWFDKKGYNVVAISKDTCGSHKRYADKQGINYILASDPEYKFSEATDSIVEKSMYGRTFTGPSRSAFVIGIDGTILGAIEKVTPKEHAVELKELIERI